MKITHCIFAVYLFFAAGAQAATPPTPPNVDPLVIEGIYEGEMHLLDGGDERDIPLAIALTMTGETIPVPESQGFFEEQQVIDGVFLIDEEGGPYSFNKVSYNLERNELDLRYNRPQTNNIGPAPSAFRLTGRMGRNGEISGKVTSGSVGPIGTFVIERTKKTLLTPKMKYIGNWVGDIQREDGKWSSAEIVVTTALGSPTVNPHYLEFEYTPGRMGSLIINTVPFPFQRVVIDYLRRRMYLSNIDPGVGLSLTAETKINFDNDTLEGHIAGINKGRTGVFRFKKK